MPRRAYERHQDADKRLDSAKKLILAVLATEGVLDAHKFDVIRDSALWKLTEAEGHHLVYRDRVRGDGAPLGRYHWKHLGSMARQQWAESFAAAFLEDQVALGDGSPLVASRVFQSGLRLREAHDRQLEWARENQPRLGMPLRQ